MKAIRLNSDDVPRGWSYITNSSKRHYFYGQRSLCARWMLFESGSLDTDDKFSEGDNCRACERKRKKMVQDDI